MPSATKHLWGWYILLGNLVIMHRCNQQPNMYHLLKYHKVSALNHTWGCIRWLTRPQSHIFLRTKFKAQTQFPIGIWSEMSTRASKKRKSTVQEVEDKSIVEITPEAMQAMYEKVNHDYHRITVEIREMCRRFQLNGQGSAMKQILVTDPPLLTLNSFYDGEMLEPSFECSTTNAKRKLCMETPSPAK